MNKYTLFKFFAVVSFSFALSTSVFAADTCTLIRGNAAVTQKILGGQGNEIIVDASQCGTNDSDVLKDREPGAASLDLGVSCFKNKDEGYQIEFNENNPDPVATAVYSTHPNSDEPGFLEINYLGSSNGSSHSEHVQENDFALYECQ